MKSGKSAYVRQQVNRWICRSFFLTLVFACAVVASQASAQTTIPVTQPAPVPIIVPTPAPTPVIVHSDAVGWTPEKITNLIISLTALTGAVAALILKFKDSGLIAGIQAFTQQLSERTTNNTRSIDSVSNRVVDVAKAVPATPTDAEAVRETARHLQETNSALGEIKHQLEQLKPPDTQG